LIEYVYYEFSLSFTDARSTGGIVCVTSGSRTWMGGALQKKEASSMDMEAVQYGKYCNSIRK